MDSLCTKIAANIKLLRNERGLSLGGFSEISGVSKSMIGQIERGESIPTIYILDKIAKGLDIPISLLISERNLEPIITGDFGKYRIYPIHAFDPSHMFGISLIELDPGSSLEISAPFSNIKQHMRIINGKIEVIVNKSKYLLKKGVTFDIFRGTTCKLKNETSSTACVLLLMQY